MVFNRLKFLVAVLMVGFVISCSSDDDDPMNPGTTDDCDGVTISYADDITPIVNKACALSGCHVAGFSSGDFTGYAGVKAKADNGSLNSRVVSSQNMPPSNSNGPTSLTDEEIMAFKCWIDAGAPDN